MKITHQFVKETCESFAAELREKYKIEATAFYVAPSFYSIRMYFRGKEFKVFECSISRHKQTGELYLNSKLFAVNNAYLPQRIKDAKVLNERLHERFPYIEKTLEMYANKVLLYRYIENNISKISLHTFTNKEVEIVELEKCSSEELLNYIIENDILDVNKAETLYQSMKLYLTDDIIIKILYDLMKLNK